MPRKMGQYVVYGAKEVLDTKANIKPRDIEEICRELGIELDPSQYDLEKIEQSCCIDSIIFGACEHEGE